MGKFEIRLVPALSDNYVYLAHDAEAQVTAVVDPAQADPVFAALKETGWTLTHILNTHHHQDHTGGNQELKAASGAPIIGPRADAERIPGIDVEVGDGDTYTVGSQTAKVYDVPGHTKGHIAFWFPDSDALFSGDTLFALGCGRLFEGTPAQMWTSLKKLRELPDSTRIYCGHEYTQSNATFAVTIEPDNATLATRSREIDALRAEGHPTIPSTMEAERATNPFLRADVAELQMAIGMADGDPVAVFAEVRQRKDNF